MKSGYIQSLRTKVGHDPVICVTAAGIIKNQLGEILLVRRNDKDAQWGLPGGYMELYETPEETVRREVLEEVGTSVNVGMPFGVYTQKFSYENGDVVWGVMLIYECDMHSSEDINIKDTDEISEVRYFPKDRLPVNFRYPALLCDLMGKEEAPQIERGA